MSITLATDVGPRTLQECWDGFEKGFDASRGPYITKHYYTEDWDATNAICDAIVGSGFNRSPHRCPEATALSCQSAKALGQAEIDDRLGGRPRFRQAIIEATYAITPWNTGEDASPAPSFPNDAAGASGPFLFMEQSIDWNVEILKTPDSSWKFDNDNRVVDSPVGMSMAVADFVLVRKWQTQLPYTNVKNYLMRLNETPLLGQPKGLLQLRRVKSRRSWTTDGQRTQDTEWAFKWREFDHNKFFHPGTGNFEFIVSKNGSKVYKYANLGAVLQ